MAVTALGLYCCVSPCADPQLCSPEPKAQTDVALEEVGAAWPRLDKAVAAAPSLQLGAELQAVCMRLPASLAGHCAHRLWPRAPLGQGMFGREAGHTLGQMGQEIPGFLNWLRAE